VRLGDTYSLDAHADFLGIFGSKEREALFRILEIGPQDILETVVEARDGQFIYKYNKRWKIASDIVGAYIISSPKYMYKKDIFTSRQKKKLEGFLGVARKTPNLIWERVRSLYNDSVPDREMHNHKILAYLRAAERRSPLSKKPKAGMFCLSGAVEAEDGGNSYEFDRRFFEILQKAKPANQDIEWIKSVIEHAIDSIKVSTRETRLPRPPNKYEWTFFIGLCNIFYEFTGEKPASTRSGGGTSHSNMKYIRGRAIDFLDICYQAFNLCTTREALHQKLEGINKGKEPPTCLGIVPKWL
jgi:hypothetical protein